MRKITILIISVLCLVSSLCWSEAIYKSIEGTGAAINVEVGWQPSYVRCVNIDDAGSLWPTVEWWSGMGAGQGILNLKVVDSGTTGNAVNNKITTAGITTYAGAAGSNAATSYSAGFTIGTNANINASGETILCLAVR